jgi:hypothetical protein
MSTRRFIFGTVVALGAIGIANAKDIAGIPCVTPPVAHCAEQCTKELRDASGNATEPKTGRKFFLDYPCDLKADEKVVFILALHGAGSIGNWMRHYFPIVDFKDKYRIVVATPSSAEGRDQRMWTAEADDQHLQNVVDFVFEKFGRRNIKSFWFAGHSQGGMTSNRIVCTDYFKDKVDGWLSLSGGRIGAAKVSPDLFGPSGPPALPAAGGAGPGVAAMPACDISYIFTSGELEITGLPTTSPWAEKYQCAARVRRDDIVDSKKGYVVGNYVGRSPGYGRDARPGTSQVYVFPKCKDGKIVADVLRMDKGHTEGLEPKVTEELIKMMISAPGGKAQK